MVPDDTGLPAPAVSVERDAGRHADAELHARRVHAAIAAAIAAAGGWIGFERYMELALYAPGLGYYSAGARKLGRDGDFVTAPELSGLFAACLARQCVQVLEAIGGGAILEVGAGSGRLCVDLLLRLESLGRLPERYYILEVGADLRDRQRALVRERVAHLEERITWLDAPPPQGLRGVILANEVLDALPVARFRWHADACEELGVALRAGAFEWSSRPGSPALQDACRRLHAASDGWDDGYVSEYCPRLAAWSQRIVEPLQQGAAVWIDYGLPRPQYYLAERHGGTLICHHRQAAHEDPFVNPGVQDISAWVDFTTLAEAGVAAGCEVAGFATQAFFLAGLGIDREMQRLAGGDAGRQARLAGEARRLLLPGEMGESFKAMAWTRGLAHGVTLAGFSLQDLRHSL